MAGDAPGQIAAGGVGHNAHDLGPQLQPGIEAACSGKLTNIRWFRTDWQMGGAATAYATYAHDDGPREVVIKLPVGPREYNVITALARTEAPTPRLCDHGHSVGGYDFAWLVMERLPGNPLSAHLHKDVFAHLADSAAHFYRALAHTLPLEQPKARHDWEKLLERSREAIRTNPGMPGAVAWAGAVKHTHKALGKLLAIWGKRAIDTWCHGDLHPGNCMQRPVGAAWGPAGYVLLDFAEVHAGHWVEDAVYMERIYWGRPQALDGVKPVSLMAKSRRSLGLDTSDDYATLANVRRILMASTTPAFLGHEGRPAYLATALETLEKLLDAMKL